MVTQTTRPWIRQEALKVVDLAGSGLFASIVGSDLYGFQSEDSDVDVRAVHVTGARELLGLHHPAETREMTYEDARVPIDFVSHDIGKFLRLVLKGNGNALECLYSPLQLATGNADAVARLRRLVGLTLSRRSSAHYIGMASKQFTFFERRKMLEVKPLLYTFRALLSGIHLMRCGRVDANLPALVLAYGDELDLGFIEPLIRRKLDGEERSRLTEAAFETYRPHADSLRMVLGRSAEESSLPLEPGSECISAVNGYLVEMRLNA